MKLFRHQRRLAGVAVASLVAIRLVAAWEVVRADDAPKGKPARTIRLIVLGEDYQPLSGARITSQVGSPAGPVFPGGDTDARGQFVLDVPEVITMMRLWVRKENHVGQMAAWLPLSQDDGGVFPPEYTFRLVKGLQIGGFVKDAQGRPIAGATVEAILANRRTDELMIARLVPEPNLTMADRPTLTDAQGHWSLGNVPDGPEFEVHLRIAHPAYVAVDAFNQLQTEQGVTADALCEQTALIRLESGIALGGTVSDPNGKPVEKAVVVWGSEPLSQFGCQETSTDARGTYQFTSLVAGPTNFTVIAPGWAPMQRQVEVAPGRPAVDFRLKPGKPLVIQFVDSFGAPVPSVEVAIDLWCGNRALYNLKVTNALDTRIPASADRSGVYRWNWAPDEPIAFRYSAPGYKMLVNQPLDPPHGEYRVILSK